MFVRDGGFGWCLCAGSFRSERNEWSKEPAHKHQPSPPSSKFDTPSRLLQRDTAATNESRDRRRRSRFARDPTSAPSLTQYAERLHRAGRFRRGGAAHALQAGEQPGAAVHGGAGGRDRRLRGGHARAGAGADVGAERTFCGGLDFGMIVAPEKDELLHNWGLFVGLFRRWCARSTAAARRRAR